MQPSPTNLPTDILSAWIALEALSPQTFRKPEELAGANGSVVNLTGPALPWENGGEEPRPKFRRYYQVIIGTINFAKAINSLLDVYADPRIEKPQARGEAILALAIVNDKGMLIDHPAANISSFAWALPRAMKGDLRSLSQWSSTEEMLRVALDKKMRRMDKDGKELPLDWQTVINAREFLINELGIEKEFVTDSLFAIRSFVWHTSPDPPETVLLNSFFLRDLAAVNEMFANGRATANLQRYIGMLAPAMRHNLLDDKKALEQPAGRRSAVSASSLRRSDVQYIERSGL